MEVIMQTIMQTIMQAPCHGSDSWPDAAALRVSLRMLLIFKDIRLSIE